MVEFGSGGDAVAKPNQEAEYRMSASRVSQVAPVARRVLEMLDVESVSHS